MGEHPADLLGDAGEHVLTKLLPGDLSAADPWRAQSATYRTRNMIAWRREKAALFGPVAERVMIDTYARLHKANPRKWPPPPRTPAWPGKALVSFLGGDPG